MVENSDLSKKDRFGNSALNVLIRYYNQIKIGPEQIEKIFKACPPTKKDYELFLIYKKYSELNKIFEKEFKKYSINPEIFFSFYKHIYHKNIYKNVGKNKDLIKKFNQVPNHVKITLSEKDNQELVYLISLRNISCQEINILKKYLSGATEEQLFNIGNKLLNHSFESFKNFLTINNLNERLSIDKFINYINNDSNNVKKYEKIIKINLYFNNKNFNAEDCVLQNKISYISPEFLDDLKLSDNLKNLLLDNYDITDVKNYIINGIKNKKMNVDFLNKKIDEITYLEGLSDEIVKYYVTFPKEINSDKNFDFLKKIIKYQEKYLKDTENLLSGRNRKENFKILKKHLKMSSFQNFLNLFSWKKKSSDLISKNNEKNIEKPKDIFNELEVFLSQNKDKLTNYNIYDNLVSFEGTLRFLQVKNPQSFEQYKEQAFKAISHTKETLTILELNSNNQFDKELLPQIQEIWQELNKSSQEDFSLIIEEQKTKNKILLQKM